MLVFLCLFGSGLFVWHADALCSPASELLSGSMYPISDDALTASNTFEDNEEYGPKKSKLNTCYGQFGCAWIGTQREDWIQADLGREFVIRKVLLQAREDAQGGWVKAFSLEYGSNEASLTKETNGGRFFPGIKQKTEIVVTVLQRPFIARIVRLVVQEFEDDQPALRWELVGCLGNQQWIYKDTKYWAFANKTTFDGARQACQALSPGADLAKIPDMLSFEFMDERILRPYAEELTVAEYGCNPEMVTLRYWIGLTRPDSVSSECGKSCRDEWQWLDRSGTSSFKHWADIDIGPDDKNVYMSACSGRNYLWIPTSDTSQEFGYVCSKELKQIAFESYEYWLFSQKITRSQALAVCQNLGSAVLATIPNEEAVNFLVEEMLPSQSHLYFEEIECSYDENSEEARKAVTLEYRIGFTRDTPCQTSDVNQCRTDWVWTEENKAADWSNWKDGEPGPDSTSVIISGCSNNQYQWLGSDPNKAQGFLCSRPIDVDECKLDTHTCQTPQVCVNIYGSFFCECENPGLDGDDCTTDKEECGVSSNCLHKISCQDFHGGYTCECQDGWTGERCDMDIDECDESTARCASDRVCYNTQGAYDCKCNEGWKGDDCKVDLDECADENICDNYGSCVNTEGSFSCVCIDGWRGLHCEEDEDECSNSPCKNFGLCHNTQGSYTCDCTSSWQGQMCSEDVNECVTQSPCLNGGTCENKPGSFKCICGPGWTGANCHIDIDECASGIDCLYGGTCENQPGDFECKCVAPWQGKFCSYDFDTCAEEKPCNKTNSKFTRCETLPDRKFKCVCLKGWTGVICDTDIDECSIIGFCQNQGVCDNTIGAYQCQCPKGWKGDTCGDDIDECEEAGFCQSGGTCTNYEGGYNCSCKNGFLGLVCDVTLQDLRIQDDDAELFILIGAAVGLVVVILVVVHFIHKPKLVRQVRRMTVQQSFVLLDEEGDEDVLENPVFNRWKQSMVVFQTADHTDEAQKMGGSYKDILEKIKEAMAHQDVDQLVNAIQDFEIAGFTDEYGHIEKAKRFLNMLKISTDITDAMDAKNAEKLKEAIEAAKEAGLDQGGILPINMAAKVLHRLTKIQSLQEAVRNLEDDEIADIASYPSPVAGVAEVMQAVFILLGENDKFVENWTNIVELMKKKGKDSVKERIARFEIEHLNLKTAQDAKVRLYYYTMETVQAISAGAAVFYSWGRGMIEICEERVTKHQPRHSDANKRKHSIARKSIAITNKRYSITPGAIERKSIVVRRKSTAIKSRKSMAR